MAESVKIFQQPQCDQRLRYSEDAWHLQRFLRYVSPTSFHSGEWWNETDLNDIWELRKYNNCPSISWTQKSLIVAADNLNSGKRHRTVMDMQQCWDNVSFVFKHNEEDRLAYPPSVPQPTIDMVV